jgi:trehalose-phosphatase
LRSLAATEDGARIEQGVSVSVHVRGAPDPEAATARLRGPAREIATRFGLAMFEGKRVIELAPPGARKGGVVRQLLVRVEPEAALYAGDDLEDGEAFRALDELDGPTCRVAVTGVESPEELLRAADLLVEGPPGLLASCGPCEVIPAAVEVAELGGEPPNRIAPGRRAPCRELVAPALPRHLECLA